MLLNGYRHHSASYCDVVLYVLQAPRGVLCCPSDVPNGDGLPRGGVVETRGGGGYALVDTL